jgi:integrase
MATKKYHVETPREGYPYDRKKGKYFSWGYDIWLGGQRIQERGFLTEEKAKQAVISLRESFKNDRLGIVNIKQTPRLIEAFQRKLDSMPEGQERTRAKRVFTYFLSLLPPNIKLIELRTAHLKDYQDARLADGVKAATVRREMVPIKELLNNAGQYDETLENYRPPKKPRLTVPKTRRTATISTEKRREVLSWLLRPCDDDEFILNARSRRRVGLFLQFCLLTASRPGEVAVLKRSDVDWEYGIVKLLGTKTQNKQYSERRLRITPTMKSILREMWDVAPGEYLFTSGGKVTGNMYGHLKEACKAAGLKYGNKDLDGVIFYTARHTATTVMGLNNVDMKTAGSFTGHSDATMTMYYTHTNGSAVEIAGEILEKNMGSSLFDGEFLESENVQKK